MVKSPKVITHPTRLRMRSFACMVSVLALAAAPAFATAETTAPAPAASPAVTPYTAAQFFETTAATS